MLHYLSNAHFTPVPVTNWWLNCVLLTSCSMADSNGYSGGGMCPEGPAKLSWNESVFASLRRMALATVSATLKGKQKWCKVTAIISDTNLGTYQSLRTASVLRFCVCWTHLAQLAILQWRETFPCITCRDRRVSSRVAKTCSTSSTPFILSPCGRNSACVRFGLHWILLHSFSS